MNIEKLVRPHIRDMQPYRSARDEFDGKADVFLDANENSLGSATSESYNRYPDPLQRDVKQKLAELKGVKPEEIFLGNGSDEPIDLLFRAFCEPKRDHVITMPPTYGMYQVSANLNQVKIVPVPLTDEFQINVGEVIGAFRPGTKITFICSPNNPSGNLLSIASIRKILEKAPGLVVVDEAYVDFSPEGSMLPHLADYPNLIVLQTFSKAWGMAGLRLGMAFAQPEIIEILNKIKPPYNVNTLTQQKALEALEEHEKVLGYVDTLVTSRNELANQLEKLDMVEKVYPSDANFLLVRVDDAPRRYHQLINEHQIVVRNRSNLALCEGCLRITVGTAAENDALLTALSSLGAGSAEVN